MKYKNLPRIISLLALLLSLLPTSNADAQSEVPPADMFQLPWQQGEAWVALDGLDNGSRRPQDSPHIFENGGALDFTADQYVSVGDDTSNFWVTATAAGTVIVASSCHLNILHENGWISEYRNLGNIQVSLGDAVYRNQRLGIVHNNDGVQVCPGNKFPYPHLHFSLRPTVENVTFSGWLVNYSSTTNITTFSKNDQTIQTWSFQPILNVPDLQIALRDPIIPDTVYTGSLDAYRYERWPLTLTGNQEFTVTATATTSGLIPIVVLLDAGGNEITRGTGSLTSTQPAGEYFVQIQPEAGQGFYDILLQGGTGVPTPTPTTDPSVPTPTPTTDPSVPTPTPTTDPSIPTSTPTTDPSIPTSTPTTDPSIPTPTPTTDPSIPTSTPTTDPSIPTPTPTTDPSIPTPTPTTDPSIPTSTPTTDPSIPTSTPTTDPSIPTSTPTTDPSVPTSTPTTDPSVPTPTPTTDSSVPTPTPTTDPSIPTSTPTTDPSVPTATPTTDPSVPTATPTTDSDEPSTTIDTPGSVGVGETILVTINLNNVPPSGYTSAEFTCTYPPALVAISNILVTDLFGTDPAVAVLGPQSGNFIVAIAGSNGQRATTSGAVFSFNVTGLQAGQASITCVTRVSTGDGALIELDPTTANITVGGAPSPTPTTDPGTTSPVLAGQVLATKPVTVSLYDAGNALTTSVIANTDGTFGLTAPVGIYTVVATASGFLSAQGPAILTAGTTTTKGTISLLAGDIDGNNVIDQYDAMTIGMNYNTVSPDAADLNADGIINVLDLEDLAANYRASGALYWD